MVVSCVTPYILVEKCQNFADTHFIHSYGKELCMLVSLTLNMASACSNETL